MPEGWSTERVLGLAPDPASAKAGQGLASAKNWSNPGWGDGLIWGECQGSGKNPYRTQVELAEPAFSCSCPSRKFPCKHALGLLLLWSSGANVVAPGTPPDWVIAWKEGRAKKAEAKKEKASAPPAPVDLAAQAKRQRERTAKVAAGLDDLSLWLSDVVRQGFASLGAKSGSLWDDQARRMIDAQAPGVARRLRQIDEMTLAGEGWQIALLDRLAKLHLLAEGFRHRDSLASEVVEDLRLAIGYPTDLDAARSGPGVRDHWQVIGHAFAVEERIVVRRTWLLGRATNRPALLLDFAAGNRPLEVGLPPGFVVDAELAFIGGSTALRAVLKECHESPVPMEALAGGTSIAEAFATHGEFLARNPWQELTPIVLQDVVLQNDGESWEGRDATGATMPLSGRFLHGWNLLAIGGGRPLTLSGEFDGERIHALGCLIDGGFRSLVSPDVNTLERTAVSAPVALTLLVEATASAVVGVDRKPLPSPAAGDPIADALAGVEGAEPPSKLLSIAAAASLYGRVGRKPKVDSSPAPEPCPHEDQVQCRDESARRLRTMLDGEQAELLPEWLELLSKTGHRMPHESIVEILNRQPQNGPPDESLIRALGVRGRWLASKNPSWRKFAGIEEDADPAAVWETGTRHERLAVLQAVRRERPARAREMLAATFAQESADDRAAFLGKFEDGLSMEDEPFLESALDDRSKEVRRRAVELLRALPESRLCQRMVERARPLLSWKKGPLGLGRGKLIVDLPTLCDKALIRDGVEPKPPSYLPIGERAWWLREIVSVVPIRTMGHLLEATASQAAAANRGGEWEAVLWSAWATSTIRHHDNEWAEALLDAGPDLPYPQKKPSIDFQLFNTLNPDRRDVHLIRRLRSDAGPLRQGHPALGFVRALAKPVGIDAAREILNRIRPILAEERAKFADPASREGLYTWGGQARDAKYHDHQTVGMIEELGQVIPLDLVDEIAKDRVVEEGPTLLYAYAFAQMIDRMTFRRDMQREFAR